MKDARFAFGENILPLKAPVDSAGTAYSTPYVNMKDQLHVTFLCYFGVITATSADQNILVTVEASTAATSTTAVQIPFRYRVSGATGANTWGAITDATASGGISLDTTTEDAKMVLIDVDLPRIEALHGQRDAKFLSVKVGIDAGGTVTLNSVIALLEPAYPQATHLSAT
jgi:hypothetical protein